MEAVITFYHYVTLVIMLWEIETDKAGGKSDVKYGQWENLHLGK